MSTLQSDFRADDFLRRTFDANCYTCWDFAREVWRELTGQDVGARSPDVFEARQLWAAVIRAEKDFVELAAPETPCLALFKRRGAEPHIGVYFKGRVLHLRRSGAMFEGLDSVRRGYHEVSYYRKA